MAPRNRFTDDEIKAFSPSEKIGLVATKDPDGLPHISLITSIQAAGPTTVTLGEFCRGYSKQYLQQRPEAGFCIMTLDKKMWRGKAKWAHLKTEGPEYEVYNSQPMFRYNTYFGINTVHYLDLIEVESNGSLPVGRIALAAISSKIAKIFRSAKGAHNALTPFGMELFNRLDSLKFISYVGEDGFPVIIPVIQAQANGSGKIVFSGGPYSDELAKIPAGTDVAVFCVALTMEDILVRGKISSAQFSVPVKLRTVEIEMVYNPMPPNQRVIFPDSELTAVKEF